VALSAARLGADGQSAYKLAAHNAAVRYDRDVRMWDCWSFGARPRLAAWNGDRWVRWSVGAVSGDRSKCGNKSNKVVFSYHVSLLGRPVKDRAYNLVRVKEHCPGCQTAKWTLPVLPPGAAAGGVPHRGRRCLPRARTSYARIDNWGPASGNRVPVTGVDRTGWPRLLDERAGQPVGVLGHLSRRSALSACARIHDRDEINDVDLVACSAPVSVGAQ
jgi:hypothetical protein